MIIQQAYDKLRDPGKRAKEDLFTYNYVRGEFHYTTEERESAPQGDLVAKLKELEKVLRSEGEASNGVREQAVSLCRAVQHR